jgi:hypothetical protein
MIANTWQLNLSSPSQITLDMSENNRSLSFGVLKDDLPVVGFTPLGYIACRPKHAKR